MVRSRMHRIQLYFLRGLPIAIAIPVYLTALALAQQPAGAPRQGAQLPDGAGHDVTQKVCGSTCHGPDIIMGEGRSRDQWTAVVNAMVGRGAKATEPELLQIAEYLTSHFGPGMTPARARAGAGAGGGASGPVTGRGPGPLGAGAADSHVVDDAGAERGKAVYIAECITCHGNKARGGNPVLPKDQQGSDLIRSLVVLRDRYGNAIGPFLQKGHPLQSGRPAASLKPEQIADLAHFLHQRVYFTLRSGPELKIQNILVGNARAGETYFNGDGKCSTCHSVTGDLKGIGRRYDAPTMQSKFLFPRSVGFGRGGVAAAQAKPITVTVTKPGGETVEGTLIALDDFNVALRNADGDYRSFRIAPGWKVVKHDPAAMHVKLLDLYTDKDMHDMVAYLESLK